AVYERDGTFVYVNAYTEKLFGHSREYLLGRRLWDVLPEAVGNLFYEAFQRVATTGRAETLEHYYAPWHRWYRNHLHLVADRVHCYGADITEPKQAELRLATLARASHAFARAAELDELFVELARTLAETLGDGCAVRRLDKSGTRLVSVAIHHADPARFAELEPTLSAPLPVGEGFAGEVFVSGNALLMAEVEPAKYRRMFHDAALRESAASTGVRSMMVVPLRDGERRIGIIGMMRDLTTRSYTAADLALLEDVADRAAMAVARARLYEQAELGRRRAAVLAKASRAFASAERDPKVILGLLARIAGEELGECALAHILSDDGTRFEHVAAVHPDPTLRAQMERITGQIVERGTLSSRVIETGRPLRVAEPGDADFPGQMPPGFADALRRVPPKSFMMVPIQVNGRPLGALAAGRLASTKPYDESEEELLDELARRASLAIENARVLEAERRASAAQASANRTLSTIIAASPAAIVLIDPDGTVKLWNPAAERIFGWSADEAIGRRYPPADPAHEAEFQRKLAELSAGNPILGHETQRMTRSGNAVEVSVWSAPIQHEDGRVQFLSILIDNTDRKRAEEAARDADRRKDEFLAMLGHELRNPLAPILTALQLLEFKGVQGGEREREIIERQARHLVRLVDDLLDVSRITRGKLELRRTRTDLGLVLAKAVEIASPLLEHRAHHLDVEAPRGTYYVDGDESRLAQVFQNLLTNAAKYTPPGGHVTVRLSAKGGSAVVEVEDNGEGIPEHVLATIFDPFVQGARRVDRSQGGLGLGLSLVHSLVTLHGGNVTAHSAGVGRGSRFVVTLPLSNEVPAIISTVVPARKRRAPGRRVLLVDDNQDAAEMLASLLRAEGHDVLVAHDGPSALAEARAFRPAVALLDIGLPVMDGYELAEKLLALLPRPLRLVALTGYGQDHDRRRSVEAGFAEHLVKPVDAADLLAAIEGSERKLAVS
ncbi:MAG TPA: ATP-binding protein, partial [Polyangiaceae bacterium]|nr:ATP-binding protein [Polyangiaceae bacterium]